MENYDVNYDPNDIATNAPDFEEPHVENNHVAHFNGDPMQDEAYRRYYEELKNSQKENFHGGTTAIKSKNHENLNLQDEKPAEISKNNKVYILKRPFQFEDEWIEELYLDLDSLTGRDIMEASKGIESYVQETDKNYLCNVAAKALKRPKEIMYFMSAKDATAICYEVSNFLIG